jgi:hypothetical protein
MERILDMSEGSRRQEKEEDVHVMRGSFSNLR